MLAFVKQMMYNASDVARKRPAFFCQCLKRKGKRDEKEIV